MKGFRWPKLSRPKWTATRLPRPSRASRRRLDRDGPGLLFILAALIVVAVAGARFFGFAPGEEPVAVELPELTPEAPVAGEPPEPAAPVEATAPRVIVYHSHATENYRPNEPHTHRGQPGDVVAVGEVLVETLEAQGLRAEHLTDVHDYPVWGEAYENSAQTVSAVLGDRDDVAAVLDVHRDAIAADVGRAHVTTVAAGESAAKILLVVGEADNPRAAANTAFAEALKQRMDETYPGLARGVRLLPQSLNGELHPHSIQVFVGDYRYNTVDEARHAARLFAQVLADELAARREGAPVLDP